LVLLDEELENLDQIINNWISSSEENYETMSNLFRSKDYSWSLFLDHLVLEKLIKAYYVRTNKKHSIFTHDLVRLATKAGLKIDDQKTAWLDAISTFNLNARYDNYKRDFQKLCTKEFTEEWIDNINQLRKWLIKQF
jgi:HEPN domain-containing protein